MCVIANRIHKLRLLFTITIVRNKAVFFLSLCGPWGHPSKTRPQGGLQSRVLGGRRGSHRHAPVENRIWLPLVAQNGAPRAVLVERCPDPEMLRLPKALRSREMLQLMTSKTMLIVNNKRVLIVRNYNCEQ